MFEIQEYEDKKCYQMSVRRKAPYSTKWFLVSMLMLAIICPMISYKLGAVLVIFLTVWLSRYTIEERLFCIDGLGLQCETMTYFGGLKKDFISFEQIIDIVINEVMKQQEFKHIIQVVYHKEMEKKIKAPFKKMLPSIDILKNVQCKCQAMLCDKLKKNENSRKDEHVAGQSRYNLR